MRNSFSKYAGLKNPDLTGLQTGYVTVLRRSDRPRFWWCRCVCGKEWEVLGCNLRRPNTRSCGCRTREFITAIVTTHGMTESRTYSSYCAMLSRCTNQKLKCFARYGAAGIKVCDRWRDSFEAFLADMGVRPEGTTLDRISSAGNYEPGNCRWATPHEQSDNRKNVHRVTARGETHTICEWSEITGISRVALYKRYKKGLRGEDLLHPRKAAA